MRIDLHTHSRVSDGTDSPAGLVREAAKAGLDVIALTDHDTFDGVAEAREAGSQFGVQVLVGIELSTQVAGESVHLLGYGCDVHDEALGRELVQIRTGRSDRLPTMVEQITAAGAPITLADVMTAARGAPVIGRPHVADALIANGHVPDRETAFALWLDDGKPGFVTRYACSLEHGIDLIHAAGGVAVVAHPWGRGGRLVLSEEYLSILVARHGLDGIEVDHPDHDAATRGDLADVVARLGVVRTGSSDYHGTGKKDHPLGSNLTAPESLQELTMRIQRRGGIR